MDLIEGIFGRRKHPHIWSELFCQRLDHILRGRRAGHTDTLCGEVPRHSILEVKTHHAMELQVLKEEKEYNNQCMLFQSILFFLVHSPSSNALLKSNYIMQFTIRLLQKFISTPSAVYD